MLELYQNREIREIESYVIDNDIFTEYQLMKHAGHAAFTTLKQAWPEARRLCVCCGKGNNAGDGYVLACLAKHAGFEVTLYALTTIDDLHGSAQQAAIEAKAAGVEIQPFPETLEFDADVIVDALLGSGLSGEVGEPFASIINAINSSECNVLAMDVPSGLDVDTGSICGTAVQANLTVTFIGYKQGLFTHKGPTYCGEIICDTLDIADDVFATVLHSAETLDWDAIKTNLPRRQRDAHKGDYGHVLIVGGDYGMGGAVRMAAESAMRAGAGLVTVATRPEHVGVVSGSRPEIMCKQVVSAADLDPLIERATVLVIGPGLGNSEWAEALLAHLLKVELPKVLDADGLNLLSENPQSATNWILTPHPGEASRLLGCSCQDVQQNRFAAADQLQQRYGGTIVLKGSGTIVKSHNALAKVCRAGNPGMASGGMGDVLSGVIGGLLAQKLHLSIAAEAGVLVHSIAADMAAKEGGERGLLATDLMKPIRELVNSEE